MKTIKAEQWLLLEQSGELGVIGRWRLARVLARDPALRKYREDLTELSGLARSRGPAGDLDSAVLGAIRQAAAEQHCASPARDFVMAAGWMKHAVAFSAILVIVAGIGTVNQLRSASPYRSAYSWNDGIDAEISRVGSQLAANFDVVADSAPADINAIARELIALEGVER